MCKLKTLVLGVLLLPALGRAASSGGLNVTPITSTSLGGSAAPVVNNYVGKFIGDGSSISNLNVQLGTTNTILAPVPDTNHIWASGFSWTNMPPYGIGAAANGLYTFYPASGGYTNVNGCMIYKGVGPYWKMLDAGHFYEVNTLNSSNNIPAPQDEWRTYGFNTVMANAHTVWATNWVSTNLFSLSGNQIRAGFQLAGDGGGLTDLQFSGLSLAARQAITNAAEGSFTGVLAAGQTFTGNGAGLTNVLSAIASTNGSGTSNTFSVPKITFKNGDASRVGMVLSNSAIYWLSSHGESIPLISPEYHGTGENITYVSGGDAMQLAVNGWGAGPLVKDPRITVMFPQGNDYRDGFSFRPGSIALGDCANSTEDPTNSAVMFRYNLPTAQMTFGSSNNATKLDGTSVTVLTNLTVKGTHTSWASLSDSSSSITIGTGVNSDFVTIVGWHEVSTNGFTYNATTGTLTNLTSGWYAVSFSASVFPIAAIESYGFQLYTNGFTCGSSLLTSAGDAIVGPAIGTAVPFTYYFPAGTWIQLRGNCYDGANQGTALSLFFDVVKR